MKRWRHRLFLLWCLGASFLSGISPSGAANLRQNPEILTAQAWPEHPAPTQPQAPGSASSARPKTQEYKLSQERYEKAVAYSRAGYTLYFFSYFLGALVLFLFLQTGAVARIRDFAERVSERRWMQGLVFVPLLILLLDFFDFPVRVYGHSLSLRYNMSVQRWGSWLWDWTKDELLGIGLWLVLALILFAMMRRSPRRWWFYFWLAVLPLMAGVVYSSPWIIDPLFHKFEPLSSTQPELVQEMQKMVARTGLQIPVERMFLMRASEKTNAMNSYVTGFGASKRIVVWDTTIQKTNREETLFIVGHELGHYALGHVWKSLVAWTVAGFVSAFPGAALVFGSLGRQLEGLWG
jgi:STE24 endopeptidase